MLFENNNSMTTADLSPEEAMTGHGFYPKNARSDGWRFIIPSLMSKFFHLKSSWKDVEQVRKDLVEYLEWTSPTKEELQVQLKGLDEIWPRISQMMRNNRGMTKLMLDHGWQSKIILKYISEGAQASSLEVFFGRAYDLAGNFVHLPYDDKAINYSVWEPIGVFIRERIQYAQAVLDRPNLKVLTCGAGFLPEWRLFGFDKKKLNHEILAIDADERIPARFQDVLGCDPSEMGVTYMTASIENVCQVVYLRDAHDVVLAQGIASYYRDQQKTKDLLAHLARVTKPGGKIIFDLQVMEPTLVRCAASMGWVSDLSPDWTAKSAIRRVQKVCDELGLTLEYKVDSRNVRPVGVMFTATKPLG